MLLAVPAARGPAAPVHPGPPCSPNDAYAALVAAAGYVPVALTGEDYIELMPARLARDRGRRHPDRLPHLQLRRARPLPAPAVRGRRQGHRWEVHYDPYDVSRIWVRNHHADGGLDHRPVDPPGDGHPAVRGLHLAARPQDRRRAGPRRHQRDRRRGRARPRCCAGPGTARTAAASWPGSRAVAALPPAPARRRCRAAAALPAAAPRLTPTGRDDDQDEDRGRRSRGPWWASGCSTRSARTGGPRPVSAGDPPAAADHQGRLGGVRVPGPARAAPAAARRPTWNA